MGGRLPVLVALAESPKTSPRQPKTLGVNSKTPHFSLITLLFRGPTRAFWAALPHPPLPAGGGCWGRKGLGSGSLTGCGSGRPEPRVREWGRGRPPTRVRGRGATSGPVPAGRARRGEARRGRAERPPQEEEEEEPPAEPGSPLRGCLRPTPPPPAPLPRSPQPGRAAAAAQHGEPLPAPGRPARPDRLPRPRLPG